jgi:hypothetical protein
MERYVPSTTYMNSSLKQPFLGNRQLLERAAQQHHGYWKYTMKFLRPWMMGKKSSLCFAIYKAFDRVWHGQLLHKLAKARGQGSLLQWFKGYLQCRLQRVIVNGQISEDREFESDVPQGSILGQL